MKKRKIPSAFKVYTLFFLLIIISCARSNENSDLLVEEPDQKNVIALDSTGPKLTRDNSKINIDKVKIYLENTLSMYGYLPKQGGEDGVITTFRDAVNELLIVSKSKYEKDNVELFLINNETSIPVNIDNNLDVIDVNSLEQKHSKGRGSSDFDKLFEKIIPDWEQDEILVFIADFIYSPGKTDVSTGLNRLRQNITKAFQDSKESDLLAVNILHLKSDFVGPYYYDNDNKTVNDIGVRPYYVFIIGNEKNVREYSNQVSPNLQKYNLQSDYYLTPVVNKIDDYSALPFTLNVGQFANNSFSSNSSQIKSVLVKNSLNNNSNVELAVSADLSETNASETYLMDASNYQLNSNDIKLISIGKIEDKYIQFNNGKKSTINPSDIKHVNNSTHVFLFSFSNTFSGVIELSLEKNMPNWIEEVSIKDGEDDRDIRSNVEKQSQTFGFNYIVEGIYEAQRAINPENKYFEITLNISQETSGSGIGSIIGWFITLSILLIIGMIIFKNKQRK